MAPPALSNATIIGPELDDCFLVWEGDSLATNGLNRLPLAFCQMTPSQIAGYSTFGYIASSSLDNGVPVYRSRSWTVDGTSDNVTALDFDENYVVDPDQPESFGVPGVRLSRMDYTGDATTGVRGRLQSYEFGDTSAVDYTGFPEDWLSIGLGGRGLKARWAYYNPVLGTLADRSFDVYHTLDNDENNLIWEGFKFPDLTRAFWHEGANPEETTRSSPRAGINAYGQDLDLTEFISAAGAVDVFLNHATHGNNEAMNGGGHLAHAPLIAWRTKANGDADTGIVNIIIGDSSWSLTGHTDNINAVGHADNKSYTMDEYKSTLDLMIPDANARATKRPIFVLHLAPEYNETEEGATTSWAGVNAGRIRKWVQQRRTICREIGFAKTPMFSVVLHWSTQIGSDGIYESAGKEYRSWISGIWDGIQSLDDSSDVSFVNLPGLFNYEPMWGSNGHRITELTRWGFNAFSRRGIGPIDFTAGDYATTLLDESNLHPLDRNVALLQAAIVDDAWRGNISSTLLNG